MERLKKTGKALLFPHMAVLAAVTPFSIGLLIYSMVVVGTESPVAIASYVISAYTLTVWCLKMPRIISFFKTLHKENRHIRRWNGDVRFRMKVTLIGSFMWNAAYAVFQLCLGFYHSSFWYCSLFGYYICLAAMRIYLTGHVRRHDAGEKMKEELVRYRNCGIVFLLMNIMLSLMVFFMVYWGRTFKHHEITTIAMAAYTFTAFTFAIINIVKYRKYESPVYSASKAISLASACVSMLTLTSTMLTTFGEGDGVAFRRIMLGSLGGAVSVFIVGMAVYMIAAAGKKLKQEFKYERK